MPCDASDRWRVAFIAAAARLAVVVFAWDRFPPAADGVYYHELARRIAEGHGYTWLWPDGVVTAAAHYPVGYPALVAPLYALFGSRPLVAMLLNAALGALAAPAVHALLTHTRSRRIACLGALVVALHPALIAYTPALMTEGITAALLACAAALAASSRASRARSPRGRMPWLVAAACGLVLGLATLVRPQCLALAPLYGLAALPRRTRVVSALGTSALVTAMTLGVCAPWTLRNCRAMGECALVSVNGGWNLLIGTNADGRGAWAPLVVPPECKHVFDEAQKDRCFARAARSRIADAPTAWLSLVPAKLGVTFDYCGAAGWYLETSNASAFGERSKLVLGAIETIVSRALLGLALIGCLPSPRASWRRARVALTRSVVFAGIAAAFSPYGAVAFAALCVALVASRATKSALASTSLAALVVTALTHATFFGAGRYQLVVLPFVAALAVRGAVRLGRLPRLAPPRAATIAP